MDSSRWIFPAEWIWTLRYGRECLGMDHRLVSITSGDYQPLLWQLQSERRRSRKELRPSNSQRNHPKKSDEGWFLFMCTELLFAISSCSPHGSADRYLHLSSWNSMHRQT